MFKIWNKLLGNAVPVELAYYIGKHVLEYINNPIFKNIQMRFEF